MMRTILASAATIALMTGAAGAQTAVYGQPTAEPMAAPPAAQPPIAERRAAAIPGEPAMAEPFVEEQVAVSPAPDAPPAPFAPAGTMAMVIDDPHVPSPAGLTPGAPLGTHGLSDQKAVAGEELSAAAPGILFR